MFQVDVEKVDTRVRECGLGQGGGKGNENERKRGGEEATSAGGGCDDRKQQILDAGDGEEEEAGSGHKRVRRWGRATVEETMALQEKGWKRRSVRAGHYEYISPNGLTFANMADAVKNGE